MTADQSWWVEAGQAELTMRAQQLFGQMLTARPAAEDWTLLQRYLSLLADLRDYGAAQKAPESVPAPADALPGETGAPADAGYATAEAVEAADAVPTKAADAGLPDDAPPADAPFHVGRFDQGLRGGILVTDTGLEIPVVERIVAAVDIRHGDLVRATPDGVLFDGRPKYFFTKLRSAGGGEHPDRREALGIVAYCEFDRSVVKAGSLEVLVPTFELREAGAAEGDVVTVAYMQSTIQDGRVQGAVVRVHETAPPAPAGVPSPGRKAAATERTDQAVPVGFTGGPRVVVVGGRNWQYYRDGIIRLGGVPEYLDGFAVKRRIEEVVSRADIVLVLKSHCSHDHYYQVKSVAKAKGRPIYVTRKENWSGLSQLFAEQIIPTWNAQAALAAD